MGTLQTLPKHFCKAIETQLGPDFLRQESELLEVYGRDWTRYYPSAPSAVVFPKETQEVARFLKLCTEFAVAVVPSGGRTGLAGGAVAAHGEVVLSLQKMDQMSEVDPIAQTVRVQAGAITERVHQHCALKGLTWPIDFASKGSSHIGGNIATNAGGVKVIRYGLTRHWVLGLQVVTMPGEILELNGALEKNNTGIDLRQLFIGSEGILGVITEATLKLTRLPGDLQVFFFGLSSLEEALRLFLHVRQAPFQVMAFEYLSQKCLESVLSQSQLKNPFHQSFPAYILIEGENVPDAWLESLFDQGLVQDGVAAQSSQESSDLWALRERIAESLANRGLLHKNDISLPISRWVEFVSEMEQVFRQVHPDLEVFLFGHIGDGNLHVNTLKPERMEKAEFVSLCEQTDKKLFQLIQQYQGSVSAEHGIGLLKKNALGYSRTSQEIEIMKGLKKVLDPHHLLNPGKIF